MENFNGSNNLTIIKDYDVARSYFPTCVCPYKNGDSFMMVEVNTGIFKGSLKPISQVFRSFDEMYTFYDRSSTVYPILWNYLICTSMCG
jgi:hypothetical protein